VDHLKDVQAEVHRRSPSGVDTFPKTDARQTMKQLRQSDVTIFCIGLGRAFQNYRHERWNGQHAPMDYLQGKISSELRAGNRGFIPVPPFPVRCRSVPQRCRRSFAISTAFSYSPSHGAKDGKFHKVKSGIGRAEAARSASGSKR